MFDRCKGKVTTFVDGVPICEEHKKTAIAQAAPDARVDEAGDWVFKKPSEVKFAASLQNSTHNDDASDDDDPPNYCIHCAMQDNDLILATRTHKNLHLCDHHFLEMTTKKASKLKTRKAEPRKLVESPSVPDLPRMIRLPDDDE